LPEVDPLRVIEGSPFFQGLEREEQVYLARQGRVAVHNEGDTLFKPGDPPRSLWMVLSGIFEVSREEDPSRGFDAVAYLGPGHLLGQSKIITGNQYRSLGRFPEGGSTVQWPRQLLLRRFWSSPALSMNYLQNMARRLEGTFAGLGRTSSKLEGNLDHFDLATIVQTVVDSKATGVIEILDRKGRVFGSIYTADKQVGPILCGTLYGMEAFLEIFIDPPEHGRFRFAPLPHARQTDDHFSVAHLLLEVARVADEYESFASSLPAEARFVLTNQRIPEGVDTVPHMQSTILRALADRPTGWRDIASELHVSSARVSLELRDLLEKEYVRVL
jgi:CRP-like cAMP-binding protein